MMVQYISLNRVRLFQETDPPPDLQSDWDFYLTACGDQTEGHGQPRNKDCGTCVINHSSLMQGCHTYWD